MEFKAGDFVRSTLASILKSVILVVLMASAELLALVLRFTARKRLAAWILALGTLPLLIQTAVELSQPWARLGGAAVQSDYKELAFELVVLALALVSLLSPRAWICFRGWDGRLIWFCSDPSCIWCCFGTRSPEPGAFHRIERPCFWTERLVHDPTVA